MASFSPAHASRGGTEKRDTPFAIGYTFTVGGIDQVCSGSLVTSTLVVTAAHCVTDTAGNKSTNYVFAGPGVALDAPINPATQPKVLKVYTAPGFVLTEENDRDDIAFIQLDKPLATKGFIRIATAAEVATIMNNAELKGYGYGDIYETNEPYSRFARWYPVNWNSTVASNTVQISSTTASACSGDSGGPITMTLPSGEEVLVAVMSGASQVVNNCGTATNGSFIMRVTTVNPYVNLIQSLLVKPKPKTYKITCVKGKTKKFVTGTNPKCPSGYKQTAKVLITK
ncbi:MAG: trypsin-like serine protease [Candidatus Nanopelagicaceae bacterium]